MQTAKLGLQAFYMVDVTLETTYTASSSRKHDALLFVICVQGLVPATFPHLHIPPTTCVLLPEWKEVIPFKSVQFHRCLASLLLLFPPTSAQQGVLWM